MQSCVLFIAYFYILEIPAINNLNKYPQPSSIILMKDKYTHQTHKESVFFLLNALHFESQNPASLHLFTFRRVNGNSARKK